MDYEKTFSRNAYIRGFWNQKWAFTKIERQWNSAPAWVLVSGSICKNLSNIFWIQVTNDYVRVGMGNRKAFLRLFCAKIWQANISELQRIIWIIWYSNSWDWIVLFVFGMLCKCGKSFFHIYKAYNFHVRHALSKYYSVFGTRIVLPVTWGAA